MAGSRVNIGNAGFKKMKSKGGTVKMKSKGGMIKKISPR